jgi:dihydroxyacid dehydratase/phosphogluconate dehydratase
MVNCDLECIGEVRSLTNVRDGDPIPINAEQQMLNLEVPVPQKEILTRLTAWEKPAPKFDRGILAKVHQNFNLFLINFPI